MNDWSRLAVDPQTMQKTRAEERTAKYKYAPDMAVQGAPIRSVSYQGLRREDRRGQLRLSLTNTYHEWPVILRFSSI